MTQTRLARVIVAGLAGDTGKSLVSLGLVRALQGAGLSVAPFKKGPDFIDAAWLGAATGVPGRNLDTFLMPTEAILTSVSNASREADIAVIEGNRGLFDGMDSVGSHSTAELAKLIGTPVVLVVDATKTTRTVAALVKGCQVVDPEVNIAGVVLNRVGTDRQVKVIREAISRETGLPVLGAIPKLGEQHLPSRHLGLVTTMEHPDIKAALEKVGEAVHKHVDVDAVIELAREATAFEEPEGIVETATAGARVRIGVLEDEAFSFYYPENLTALENAGAELLSISPLRDRELPDIDTLYAGGGFPEVHAAELSANEPLRRALKDRIDEGLPVWAECGGLMYLSRALVYEGTSFPMVGALPVEVEQLPRPQGHGYVMARVDGENPFLEDNTTLKGHEFHYSRLCGDIEDVPTMLELRRGTGIGKGRDGIKVGSVVATYTHFHALGTPEWAGGLVGSAMEGI
ncbi:MAG: hydrogenobyrinic acid a,c-diamide synthase (glutamine-hydrolyzing) [Deltaproteobacteria bacterium]|nr:hydrogenobyrinic acid a,c-diamide synthase (glutamine-hydrolyzing) [Deltaproteobacteria bacterium]